LEQQLEKQDRIGTELAHKLSDSNISNNKVKGLLILFNNPLFLKQVKPKKFKNVHHQHN
jgi:hypothetical protein